MVRCVRRSALLAALLVPALAAAAPRVGVVILTHEGLTDEQADEIAYDLAAAVASQIEGEAIAGQSVRDLLPSPPAADCFEDAGCARGLAATMKVDEVLLVNLQKSGRYVATSLRRVPRDSTRSVTSDEAQLGRSGKRAAVIIEVVDRMYPTGSALPWVEPPPAAAPAPQPAHSAPLAAVTPPPPSAASERAPVYKQKWFWPVVGGGAAVVALAVILGVTLGTTASPSGPAITLP
jgi:hypothetical protein